MKLQCSIFRLIFSHFTIFLPVFNATEHVYLLKTKRINSNFVLQGILFLGISQPHLNTQRYPRGCVEDQKQLSQIQSSTLTTCNLFFSSSHSNIAFTRNTHILHFISLLISICFVSHLRCNKMFFRTHFSVFLGFPGQYICCHL